MNAQADSVRLEPVTGADLERHLDAVAALRVRVFRDWPYLYDGDPAYEAGYLRAYAASPRSVVVLALAGSVVVGASTGLPLADDTPPFQAPFLAAGLDPARVFYLGESVLLPEYRGRGLGHGFFAARERHAAGLGGFTCTAFAAVDRAPDDPRRPGNHRELAPFWKSRGYRRQPGLTMRLGWKELGAESSTDKPLTFWLRPLPPV